MAQTTLVSPDVYGRTFQLDQPTLTVIANRLEARAKHPFFAEAIAGYMDALRLSGPEAILDLGCGTAVAARHICRRPECHGPVTAIDISDGLIAEARRHALSEGVDQRIDFRVGDAHGLGLPAGGFDVVVMHTLISHVAQPEEVLAEGARLLRPGTGRLVIFDGDYASMTFATEAPDGGEETDRAIQSALAAQPRVMRAMPRLLADAGLDLVWSKGYVVADLGRMDFWRSSLVSQRMLLPKAGVMTEVEANALVDRLERASAEGRFFAASNFYTYIAQVRP
jgi:SAM-dependent methyltransferase